MRTELNDAVDCLKVVMRLNKREVMFMQEVSSDLHVSSMLPVYFWFDNRI